jgi:hypothetical protein
MNKKDPRRREKKEVSNRGGAERKEPRDPVESPAGSSPAERGRIAPRVALRRLAIAAILVALAVAPFLPGVSNGFSGDDLFVVKNDPRTYTLHNALQLFTEPYWQNTREGAKPPAYRPITQFSYTLNAILLGFDNQPFHAVNLALHAIVTLLVWRLARLVGASEAASFWGASLFAVHAVHVEPVIQMVGRAELLAAVGVLGALLLHAGGQQPVGLACSERPGTSTRSLSRITLAALLFLMGLGSKENAAAFLGLAPALDAIRGARRGDAIGALRRRWPAYALYAAVGVVYLLARHHALRWNTGPVDYRILNPIHDAPTRIRALTSLWVITLATRLLFFPVNLNAYYAAFCVPIVKSLLNLRALLGAGLVLGGVVGLVHAYRRRHVAIFFSIAIVVLAYGPVSNLVIPIGWTFGERFLYLPSVGACILGGLWITAAAGASPSGPARGARKATAFALATLALVWMAVRVVDRIPDWKNDLTLYRATARVCPDSAAAHNALGYIYAHQGRLDEAIREYSIMHRLVPYKAEVAFLLADCYRRKEQPDRAIAFYREALRLSPTFLIAAGQLSDLLRQKGDVAGAERVYLDAMQANERMERERLMR